MKKLHKLIAFLGSLILVLCFAGCFTSKVQAAQNVLDQAGILDHSTVHYIDQLNDNELSKIKGHPQLVVVTKKSLDDTSFDNIDDYGQYLFDKYHFGRAGYDNGVLLLVVLDPHGFRMQTGYGAESVLPDNYVHILMSPEVKDLFRRNDYNQGIKIMADKAVNRMQTHASDFRSKSEVNTHQAAVLREEKEEQKQEAKDFKALGHAIVIIIGIALLIGFGYLIYCFFASRAEAKRREQEEVARKEREAKEAAELKKQREQEEAARKERDAKEAAKLRKQREENAKLAKQFDEQAKNAKLSPDNQQTMANMDTDDKAKIMKKVLAGALIGSLIASWCDDYRTRKRLEEERQREDEEAWERFRAHNWASNAHDDETSNTHTHHSHHNKDNDDNDNNRHHHNRHHHDDDGGWGGSSSSDDWDSNSGFNNDDDDNDSWGSFGSFGGFGGSDNDDFGGFGGFSGGGGGDDSW